MTTCACRQALPAGCSRGTRCEGSDLAWAVGPHTQPRGWQVARQHAPGMSCQAQLALCWLRQVQAAALLCSQPAQTSCWRRVQCLLSGAALQLWLTALVPGRNCPFCSQGGSPCQCSSLQSTHPALAEQWDSKLIDELLPAHFSAGSGHQAWWRCSYGHSSWRARIHTRIYTRTRGDKPSGCPQCAREAASWTSEFRCAMASHAPAAQDLLCCAGQPPLAQARPDLAAQWHPDNDPLTDNITLGSNELVRWLCETGLCGHRHVWTATVKNRAQGGNGCPVCSGHQACSCTSIKAVCPDLLEEWDWEANTKFGPEDLLPGSNELVAWCCKRCSFRWEAMPKARTGRHKTGCPECAREAAADKTAAGWKAAREGLDDTQEK